MATSTSWTQFSEEKRGTTAFTVGSTDFAWMMLSLILFVFLGPFSAPIALFACFQIGGELPASKEPQRIEI